MEVGMTDTKDSHVLLAVHITDRVKKAPLVQEALTQYGDAIRTRLGLHDVGVSYASPGGVLILDIVSDTKAVRLQQALDGIEGIETKLIIFEH